MDQAQTLRKIFGEREKLRKQSRVGSRGQSGDPLSLVISSGKGGVGKTFLTAALGAHLARLGSRVLVIDGDMGLANLDLMLGVRAQVPLEEVLAGRKTLAEAVVPVEMNLWLLPAASGLMDLKHSAGAYARARFLQAVEECGREFDVILVDTGAGAQENVLSLHHSCFESVVVLTPEIASVSDAYSLVKLLRRKRGITKFSIIVNQVADGRDAQKAFQALKSVTDRFLDIQLEYLGHCARDEKITQAVLKGKILVNLMDGSGSKQCLELLARKFHSDAEERGFRTGNRSLSKDMSSFWGTLIEVNT